MYVSASVHLPPSFVPHAPRRLQALDRIVSLCETTAESELLGNVCEGVFRLLDSHAVEQPELAVALLEALLKLLQPATNTPSHTREQHNEPAQKHNLLAQYILDKYIVIIITSVVIVVIES